MAIVIRSNAYTKECVPVVRIIGLDPSAREAFEKAFSDWMFAKKMDDQRGLPPPVVRIYRYDEHPTWFDVTVLNSENKMDLYYMDGIREVLLKLQLIEPSLVFLPEQQ